MTCIAGLKHGGKLYMGADSLVSNAVACSLQEWPKVFHNGPLMIGYASSNRMGQILQHCLEVPEVDWENLDRYMADDLSRAVREALRDNGWIYTDCDRESGGVFLVGIGGRLFEAQEEFSFLEPSHGYAAIGTGGQVAMGALFATADCDLDPTARVRAALLAAQEFTPYVREPFVIEIQDAPTLTAQVRLVAE